MADWAMKDENKINYTPNGETLGGFAEKYMATVTHIFQLLNLLHSNGAMAGLDDSGAQPYSWAIDTTNDTVYIRNGDNTEWVPMGSVAPWWGLDATQLGAIKNKGGMVGFKLGLESDLPPTDNETYDFYFAWDAGRLYIWTGSDWRVFLSRQFKDMLDYEKYCINRNEVGYNGADKILRLDKKTGKGNISITGSAECILGFPIETPIKLKEDGTTTTGIKDGDALVFNADKQKFVNLPNQVYTDKNKRDITEYVLDVQWDGNALLVTRGDTGTSVVTFRKATQAADGLMSKEDKAKLDMIDILGGEVKFVLDMTRFATLDDLDSLAEAYHEQGADTVDSMAGYVKAQSAGPILETDTLNVAIGKLEKAVSDAIDTAEIAETILNIPTSKGLGNIWLS